MAGWSQGLESQMRLNGDLTPPPYRPGVHLTQKKLLCKHFLNSLLCPSFASQVLHSCSAPGSDVPARRGKLLRGLCPDIRSEKAQSLDKLGPAMKPGP